MHYLLHGFGKLTMDEKEKVHENSIIISCSTLT